MRNKFDDFDRDFNRMQTGFWIAWIFSAVIGLGLLGFFVWVVIMPLRFFGVI